MSLQNDLSICHEITPARLDRFASLIDSAWIEQALDATGTASLRRRRLPAEQVIWLVIGLALFRNQPIWHIVRQLALDQGNSPQGPVPSATVSARQRLGAAPLAWLFDQLGHHWTQAAPAPEVCFHGLRPLAVDGVVWATPDTPSNRQAYGSTANQHRTAPWPQVRATCLMDTHTHLIRAASLSGMAIGELTSARELIAHVPDHSLTLFDRLYYAATFLLDWQHAGTERHWLMRAKPNLRYEIITTFAAGDWWVRLPVSQQARAQRPDLPATWEARLIECRVGGQLQRYLTSLSDPRRYPAREVVAHYAQRWEIELGFREIKQGLLHNAPVLRSKQPELVGQELWGTLLAYNVIREEMRQMADELTVSPQRLSFQWLTLAITMALTGWSLDDPETLPERLQALRKIAARYLLPPRRPRSYPREVKQRSKSYPRKNASQLN